MPDYVPASDHEFKDWTNHFMSYLSARVADLGLVPGDQAPTASALMTLGDAYMAMSSAEMAVQIAAQAKKDARATAETAIRALVRRLQASPAVSDTERAALGITVRDTTPTIHSATSAPALASRPVGVVDTSQRLQHTLSFYDSATPKSHAKPKGVMGCEIFVKIGGPAPADPSECTFLALDTASPYLAAYAGADANKMAHYLLRWATNAGDKGPWSGTVSATIGG
jgi:hypothetical protein